MTDGTRVAIVTGGGYGIGRAASRLLAADGWSLVIVDVDIGRAQETERAIRGAGGIALAVTGDVSDAATAAAAVEQARGLGPLGGLVTCAAMRHEGIITAITPAQWDETVGVVLRGVFLFCQAAIPDMIANGGGAIVNVSSPDAYGRKAMVAYAAAKGGVNSLTLCLAADHAKDRVRVNAILPGFTLTGMTEHYAEERIRSVASRSVAGRPGQPEDIARLIRFLLSEDGATFTGGMFGGRYLADR
jgi:NAD(P)-dependent dehydrogenase (short-subunit alcohol dehydrogenase family)